MSPDGPIPVSPPPNLRDFVAGLTTTGEVTVEAFTPATTTQAFACDTAAIEALQAWDAAARDELSGNAPPLNIDAAGWALRQFYRASQLLVCRDVPPEVVTAILGPKGPGPGARDPAVDFSVDLVFRFLPDLHDRARRIAPGDALIVALETLACEWPLSSPGIALAEPPALESFASDATLWRLYVDRVAARHAADRWRDARVARQLRIDLGARPELAPALARALEQTATATPAVPSLSA